MKKLYIVLILFVFSLDAFSQNLVWAKQMSGNNNEQGFSLTLDASGNIYTAGQFWDTTDFDPGPGIYNLISAGVSEPHILAGRNSPARFFPYRLFLPKAKREMNQHL